MLGIESNQRLVLPGVIRAMQKCMGTISLWLRSVVIWEASSFGMALRVPELTFVVALITA